MSTLTVETPSTKTTWESHKLSEVASVVNGGTPKSKVAEYWNGSNQWLTPADMGKMEGREIGVTPRTITSEGLAKSSAKLVPPNSVILSTRAPIGHLAINSEPMAFNQGCRGLVASDSLDHVFLYYFLQANRELLNDLGTGTTFKELSATNLKSVEIPLPPLEEQKRIVAVLDQAFAALDRARANAEANLSDAEELFENGCDDVFEGLTSKFATEKLANLSLKITKGSSPKWQGFAYVDEPGVLFVTSENVLTNAMSFEKTKYVEEGFNEKDAKSILQNGDVLTNIVGASIGRTAVFERDDNANINQAVCLIRCNVDVLRNHFLAYLLNSPYFKKMLHQGEVNMARANLSLTFFRDFAVPLPPLSVQDQIIEKIDALRKKTDAASYLFSEQLQDIDDLRQSILQKAFAGELT